MSGLHRDNVAIIKVSSRPGFSWPSFQLPRTRPMTAGHLIFTIAFCALAAGCDSRAVPTAPEAPASTPAPLAPNPPAEPDWGGTFVSSNWSFSPFPIRARLERTGNNIKGTWFEVQWLDFGGTIEGTIDET